MGYSNTSEVSAKRKHQPVFLLFPSYAFSDNCADGVSIAEIKSTAQEYDEKFDNPRPKPLDLRDYSTNNAVIDFVLMYSLIRSEQAEEGKRFLAFMARVIC